MRKKPCLDRDGCRGKRKRLIDGSVVRRRVVSPALLPYLDVLVAFRLSLDFAHLHHGFPKVLLELVHQVSPVGFHQCFGVNGAGKRSVRVEERVVVEHVLVVLAVQDVRGLVVLVHTAGVTLALPVKVIDEGLVHARAAGSEDAAGAADGVSGGEKHQVGPVEPLVGEFGHESVEGGEGPRQRACLVGGGLAPVPATGRRLVLDLAAAEVARGVARGEGEDVGAGDRRAGAGLLQRGLGFVDHVQAAQAVLVGSAFPLRVAVP